MDIATISMMVVDLVWHAISGAALGIMQQAHQPGGEVYEQVVDDVISEVNTWYGMYTPQFYQRTNSLYNRGYVGLSSGGGAISGYDIIMTWTPFDFAPHFGYTKGFMMRNGVFRPGHEIIEIADRKTYEIDIDIPNEILEPAVDAAVERVLSMLR